jgi:hypothetical protein
VSLGGYRVLERAYVRELHSTVDEKHLPRSCFAWYWPLGGTEKADTLVVSNGHIRGIGRGIQ